MARPPESFHTARLWGRRPTVTDAPAVFAAYAGDPVATRFLSWKAYTEIAPLEEFIRQRVRDWDGSSPHFAWLLFLQGTDAPIGSIGCIPDGGKVVFGYVLGRQFWGRGLAAEALRFLVDWNLQQPDVFRAWAFCDVENPASARVMEKAGMAREGILRRWHVCPNLGPELRDCFIYAKVK
jgi:ribosomal-protein-alanine N-acetyltransferase